MEGQKSASAGPHSQILYQDPQGSESAVQVRHSGEYGHWTLRSQSNLVNQWPKVKFCHTQCPHVFQIYHNVVDGTFRKQSVIYRANRPAPSFEAVEQPFWETELLGSEIGGASVVEQEEGAWLIGSYSRTVEIKLDRYWVGLVDDCGCGLDFSLSRCL